jgi:hypothetical protein
MKIAICVPHYGDPKTGFVKCLADLLIYTMGVTITYNGVPTRPQIEVLWEENGLLEYKRAQLVRRAQRAESHYVLFIDTDQIFPPDALIALMAHDKPIIGCNYLTRHDPFWPTAMDGKAEPIWTTKAKAEAKLVEPVAAMGLGFCLIQTPVLTLLDGKILFRSEMTPEGEMVRGEDVHFFNMVGEAGIPVFVDHALSWRIGHIIERVRFNSEGEGTAAGASVHA